MLIDIHAHFDMLETTHDETIRLAQEAGVNRMITIGTEPSDHQIVLDIAKKYFPVVACTLGVHPHHGVVWTEAIGDFLNQNLPLPYVVAVGEIGLDYYYNQSPREEQMLAFRRQLEISISHQLPVQIHTRDAEEDTVNILKSFAGQVRGVVHCFTGSPWLAQQCLDLGLNISFSGIVTFKNATELQQTCKNVPLDRLHVETDSPFLAPVPLRGRKNTPAYVTHTADFVAALHGISREELDLRTNENARHLFSKLKW